MEKAWRDAVNANALSSPRRGEFARQAEQSGLARGVAGVVRPTGRSLQARDGRYVDDAAVLTLQHFAPRCLRKQKRASQVDVDHFLPLIERHRFGILTP